MLFLTCRQRDSVSDASQMRAVIKGLPHVMDIFICFVLPLFDKGSSPNRSMFNFNSHSGGVLLIRFYGITMITSMFSCLFMWSKKKKVPPNFPDLICQGVLRFEKIKASWTWQGVCLPEDVQSKSEAGQRETPRSAEGAREPQARSIHQPFLQDFIILFYFYFAFSTDT